MKNKIKNFLFKKRVKILRNKKGFSLMEVMIAVGIIGVIAGIAVPQFQEYRITAAVTVVNTTGDNIVKAYNLCTATKTSCNTLEALKMKCDICKSDDIQTTAGLCVPMEQKIQNQSFKACVHISTDGTVTKTYGGALKICYVTSAKGKDGVVGGDVDTAAYVPNDAKHIITCDELADCTPLDGEGTTGNTFTKDKCEARTGGAICASGLCT